MKQFIYKFEFPNGKIYIGRTEDFNRRLAEHKRSAIVHPKYSKLYKAINKYGWDNIKKEIIDEVDSLQEAIAREYEWIVKYDCFRKGYNSTLNTIEGGNNWAGREDSKEFEEFRKYMSVTMKGANNGMWGKKHNDKTRKLLKQKAKGRFTLPWFIKKYGEQEGTQKYQDRCNSLRIRNLKRYHPEAVLN